MSKYMPEYNIFQTKSNLMMTSPESLETRLLLEVKLRNNAYVTHIFKCLPKFSLTFFSSMDFFLIFFFSQNFSSAPLFWYARWGKRSEKLRKFILAYNLEVCYSQFPAVEYTSFSLHHSFQLERLSEPPQCDVFYLPIHIYPTNRSSFPTCRIQTYKCTRRFESQSQAPLGRIEVSLCNYSAEQWPKKNNNKVDCCLFCHVFILLNKATWQVKLIDDHYQWQG